MTAGCTTQIWLQNTNFDPFLALLDNAHINFETLREIKKNNQKLQNNSLGRFIDKYLFFLQ